MDLLPKEEVMSCKHKYELYNCRGEDEEESEEERYEDTVTMEMYDTGEEEEDREVEEEEEEDNFHVMRGECSIYMCLRHKYCVMSVYVTLLVVMVASSVALVIVCVMVALPVLRTVHFRPGTCSVIGVERLTGTDSSCSCGRGCQSHFPCLKITVEYYATDSDTGRKRGLGSDVLYYNASLHDNEIIMDGQVNVQSCEMGLQTSVFTKEID